MTSRADSAQASTDSRIMGGSWPIWGADPRPRSTDTRRPSARRGRRPIERSTLGPAWIRYAGVLTRTVKLTDPDPIRKGMTADRGEQGGPGEGEAPAEP